MSSSTASAEAPPNRPVEAEFRSRLAPPRNPVAILVSPIAWRSVLYCATAIICGLTALLAGILGLLVLPLVAWATTNVERLRLTLLGLPRLKPLPRDRRRRPWEWAGFGEGNLAVWGITVLFGLVDFVPGLFLSTLVIGLGMALVHLVDDPFSQALVTDLVLAGGGLVVVLIVGLYTAWALAAAQAILVDLQLRPHSELSQQVAELTSSRRELVDVFAAERRRIERDLHDGTQQHLVLLSMQLGEADYALTKGDADAARRALNAAQGSIEAAMISLRETVRGIHPQLLTDRGLEAAVRELAARQPVPAQVVINGSRQPSEQVASAAYYVVSEAFTNAAKHSGASALRVTLELSDPLVVEVYDNGRGGAEPAPGHGLRGLAERVAAVGGQFWPSSPIGGPTNLRASIPDPSRS